MAPYLFLWLLAANIVAFTLMVVDKRRAEARAPRIPEHTLLRWAFFGGGFGTFAASRIIRHKTHKQPFATWMMVWLWLQIVLLVLWATGLLDRVSAEI
ncbi:DUF1294 domain-containing protein [Sphingopyxis sp. LARHCG72]